MPLDKKLDQLYCFRASANKKLIITVERILESIELGIYTLKGEKKSIRLTEGGNFLPINDIIQISILIDELDSKLHPILTQEIIKLFNNKEKRL